MSGLGLRYDDDGRGRLSGGGSGGGSEGGGGGGRRLSRGVLQASDQLDLQRQHFSLSVTPLMQIWGTDTRDVGESASAEQKQLKSIERNDAYLADTEYRTHAETFFSETIGTSKTAKYWVRHPTGLSE